MTFPKHNNDYWEKKIVAYFHDSPDKIFSIPGHEDRAAGILEILGMQQPNDKVYKSADTLAAGIERGLFPGYHANPEKSGAVDFMQHPYLTHPISKCAPLKIAGLTTKDVDDSSIRANDVNSKLQDFLQKAIKQEPGLQTNQEVVYHKRLFFYIHLVLRFQLAKSNVAGLGALWHRIPADSRIPDHSIWHHNALTSALYSCGYDYASEKYREDQRIEAALCTFTITPVQSFINNARRLTGC